MASSDSLGLKIKVTVTEALGKFAFLRSGNIRETLESPWAR